MITKKNKKNILLIEDDPNIIEVYSTSFRFAKIDSEVISWGSQALKRIKEMQENKKEKPDLIILDLILPDINGIEVLKEIKGNAETKDIPVFVLSNYTSQDGPQINNVKPDKFILKTSITPTELVKLIKNQLK